MKVKEIEFEIPSYTISEAAKVGISSIVKKSEKEGIVLLKRNEQPAAIVLPISSYRFIDLYYKIFKLEDDISDCWLITSNNSGDDLDEMERNIKTIDIRNVSRSLVSGLVSGFIKYIRYGKNQIK